MTTKPSNTQIQVSEYLASRQIKMSCTYMKNSQADKKSTELQFRWTCAFEGPSRKGFSAEYFQGIGHAPKEFQELHKSAFSYGKPTLVVDHDELVAFVESGVHRKYGKSISARRPDEASVLSCILSDAQAGDQSFEDFCSECGYDSDSRKAEGIWNACREIMFNVRRFFRSEELETLRNLLQDF